MDQGENAFDRNKQQQQQQQKQITGKSDLINDKGQPLKERMRITNIVANASDFCFRFLLFMHVKIKDCMIFSYVISKTNSYA